MTQQKFIHRKGFSLMIHFLEAFLAVQDVPNDLVRPSRKFIVDGVYLGPINLVWDKDSMKFYVLRKLKKFFMNCIPARCRV